jgi:pimeloyl-ACP methyl ester carboxylesterase
MSQPRRRLAAAAVAALAALLGAACGGGGNAQPRTSPTAAAPTSPAAGAAPTTTVAPVSWSSCRGGAGPKGYQCATVAVPRDPGHPGGATIPMAIDRHPATGHKIGSLLIYPGGPGASGVDFLAQIAPTLPKELRAAFDLVGFDPPGVARTAPIRCLDSAGLAQYFHTDPAPPTAAGFQALVASDRTLAAGCQVRSGAELPYVSTADAARDLDVLRAALGDAGLTYLGFSYGTLLGATYASLFPGHVRALVLDGALDPALPPITAAEQQAAALDGELQRFFADCAGDQGCEWKPGENLSAAYQALFTRVRANPLSARHTARTVGPSEFLYGTAAALYSTSTWGNLAAALQAASQGDGTDLLNLSDAYLHRHPDGTYDNLLEAEIAINCLQAPAPSLAAVQAAAPAAETAAPVFGLLTLDGTAQCAVWPLPPTASVGPIRAPASPPIVVVGSTGDPITPYSWARSLSSELGTAVLLTRVGNGHTAYGSSSCIRQWVDRYLITRATPPAGTRCLSQ